MQVSIIIVNYNTFKLTCNCIDSVIKYTNGISYEIVVVDNASTKDNADDFHIRYPFIKLVKSRENGGFAKGNNQGIRQAVGDIILLLNSDTYLTEDSISLAAKKLTNRTDIGALTVRLVYPDGKLQHTARKFRSIRNELLDLTRPLLKLMPYKQRSQLMLNQYFKGDYSTYCDWVSGAFMMFHKSLLQKLPGNILDERYFMYGEDGLWCYQFTELGYRNYYLADTTVVHIHGGSTEPSKQLQLLDMFITLELDMMQYRKGKSFYYYTFAFIFTIKEKIRYYIKVMAFRLFNVRIR